jgi:hypothetical protein
MSELADIFDDESFQTQLHNHDAMAGLDDYTDEMVEIDAVLSADTGLSVRGAATPRRAHTTWPQAMVIDCALALDPLDEILNRYGMTTLQWEVLSENTAFKLDLARARKEISESGLSFQRKAATQAEMYLIDMDTIMRDPDASASLKHSIFNSMARLGKLEPQKEKDEVVNGFGGFNIQINF